MRSSVLSIPTTRPPPSTTGPPSTPRSSRRAYASSTRSVGEKKRTSVVITSRTNVEPGISGSQPLEDDGQEVWQVPCDQPAGGTDPTGPPVQPRGGRGRLERRHALGQD